MHETSLMYEIIQSAQNAANDHAINKVTSIELIIGDKLSVLPKARSFAFECL
ncbi:MAG: hydrogenase/urease maturation nickel metallochaperone HypA [Paenibacillus sp.]|uniref:hydrogenase/urease maturation nickel metallochaperone HypA n=1 Tax=Paenibacillus sp. TaxID=58172 RepID=UPI003B7F2EA5